MLELVAGLSSFSEQGHDLSLDVDAGRGLH